MMQATPEQLAYWREHAADDRRAWFVGGNALCLVVAFAAVVLRVLSRVKIGTMIGLDDWLIGVAAVSLFPSCGSGIVTQGQMLEHKAYENS